MNRKIAERLKLIAKKCGGNRALCAKSGVSERTFANWLSGSAEPKAYGISAIADAAKVSLDWLIAGRGPMLTDELHLGSAEFITTFREARDGGPEPFELVTVPYYDSQLAAGGGSFNERAEIIDYIPFNAGFLRDSLGYSKTHGLAILRVSGDSMEPTISDGEVVLIDQNQRKLEDGIFAYVHDEGAYVKRLQKLVDGVQIVSDNSIYAPQKLLSDQMERFKIIGRVRLIFKTI